MGEVRDAARRLGHGVLAEQLKMMTGATTFNLTDEPVEEDPMMVMIEEAATRLNTLDMVQQLDAGLNTAYTEADLKGMDDMKLAGLLEGQSTSVFMGGAEGEAPLDLSAHGDGCLERRLAKEAARRLKLHASERVGKEHLVAFTRERVAKVEPFRPE